jgi:hypothetical protein
MTRASPTHFGTREAYPITRVEVGPTSSHRFCQGLSPRNLA